MKSSSRRADAGAPALPGLIFHHSYEIDGEPKTYETRMNRDES